MAAIVSFLRWALFGEFWHIQVVDVARSSFPLADDDFTTGTVKVDYFVADATPETDKLLGFSKLAEGFVIYHQSPTAFNVYLFDLSGNLIATDTKAAGSALDTGDLIPTIPVVIGSAPNTEETYAFAYYDGNYHAWFYDDGAFVSERNVLEGLFPPLEDLNLFEPIITDTLGNVDDGSIVFLKVGDYAQRGFLVWDPDGDLLLERTTPGGYINTIPRFKLGWLYWIECEESPLMGGLAPYTANIRLMKAPASSAGLAAPTQVSTLTYSSSFPFTIKLDAYSRFNASGTALAGTITLRGIGAGGFPASSTEAFVVRIPINGDPGQIFRHQDSNTGLTRRIPPAVGNSWVTEHDGQMPKLYFEAGWASTTLQNTTYALAVEPDGDGWKLVLRNPTNLDVVAERSLDEIATTNLKPMLLKKISETSYLLYFNIGDPGTLWEITVDDIFGEMVFEGAATPVANYLSSDPLSEGAGRLDRDEVLDLFQSPSGGDLMTLYPQGNVPVASNEQEVASPVAPGVGKALYDPGTDKFLLSNQVTVFKTEEVTKTLLDPTVTAWGISAAFDEDEVVNKVYLDSYAQGQFVEELDSFESDHGALLGAGIIRQDSDGNVDDNSYILLFGNPRKDSPNLQMDFSATYTIFIWDRGGVATYTYTSAVGVGLSVPQYYGGYLYWVEIPAGETPSEAVTYTCKKSRCDLTDVTTVATGTVSKAVPFSHNRYPYFRSLVSHGYFYFALDGIANNGVRQFEFFKVLVVGGGASFSFRIGNGYGVFPPPSPPSIAQPGTGINNPATPGEISNGSTDATLDEGCFIHMGGYIEPAIFEYVYTVNVDDVETGNITSATEPLWEHPWAGVIPMEPVSFDTLNGESLICAKAQDTNGRKFLVTFLFTFPGAPSPTTIRRLVPPRV